MSQITVRILAQDLTAGGVTAANTRVKSLTKSAGAAINRLMLMGTLAAGAAVKALNAFTDFDKRIAEITTLLDTSTNKEFKQLADEVQSMSIRFGQSVESMAKARYDIVSAGFRDIAQSAEIMQQSAMLAVGGVATVAETADVMTSVLNAFKSSGLTAADAADTLFTTVRLGKTTMTELAHTMGRMVAIAPTVGVGFAELSAGLATLTQLGQKTEEATTALRQTMLAFVKPSKDMEKKINDLGYVSGAALIKAEGFAASLAMVTQGANEADLGKLFRNIRAFQAAVPMATNASQQFAENLQLMGERAGAAKTAFELMEERMSFRIAQIQERFKKAFRSIGGWLAEVLEAFFKWPGYIKNVAIAVGALVLSFKLLGGPITLIIAAAVAFYRIWDQNLGGVQTRFEMLWESIKFEAADALRFIEAIGRTLVAMASGNFALGVAQAGAEFATYITTREVLMETHTAKMNELAKKIDLAPDFDWAKLLPDASAFFDFDDSELQEKGAQAAITYVNSFPSIYAKTWNDIHKKLFGEVAVASKTVAQMMIRGVTDWEHFQTQTTQRMAQDTINLMGNYVGTQVANHMKKMLGETKSFFGGLFASILSNFISMLAEMTARWLAFKALTSLLGGPFGLFFSQGGIVPQRAQSGLRVGTDTVPALLTPGESVISRENTRKFMPQINQMMGGQKPSGSEGGGGGVVNVNFTIHAIDSQSVSDFIIGGDFKRSFITALNQGKLKLHALYVTQGGLQRGPVQGAY